jgi:hypothetical protein
LQAGLLAVTGLALALRLWGIWALGDLDFDEQASSFIASMPPAEMLRYLLGAPFEHPPFYYLLLHGWITLVGNGETALRLSSAIVGTLVVPLVGAVVARSAGPRAGLVAALALAVSPLHVFYSRDARMYPLLSLEMALVLLGATYASGGARRARFALAAGTLGALAALATHYYAVLGICGALAGIVRRRRGGPAVSPSQSKEGVGRTGVLLLVGAGLLACIAAVVWFQAASGLRTSLTVASPRAVSPLVLAQAVVESLGALLAGPLGGPWLAGLGGLLMLAAIAQAVRSGGPSRRVALGGFLSAALGVPLLIILGREFAPRFEMVAASFGVAVLGLASQRLGRRALVGAVGIYGLIAVVGLVPMYGGFTRSDYGHAMAALRAQVRPDDAIVLNGPWQDLLYQRYGWGLPPRAIIASTVPLDPPESIGWLARLAGEHPRLWVVDSASDAADPQGVVAAWLDRNAYPRPVISFEKALLRPYLTDAPGSPPLVAKPVALDSLDVRVNAVALDHWVLVPGDEARLRIDAQPTGPRAATDVVARLIAPDGTEVWHWDGPLASLNGSLAYRAAVLVPTAAAPGSYVLQVVAYRAQDDGAGHRRIDAVDTPANVATLLVEGQRPS